MQLLAILVVALTAAPAPSRLSIGLAELSFDGQLCLAMPGPPLTAGSPVTLVSVNPPQKATAVLVARQSPVCERLQRADLSGPFYVAAPSGEMNADDGIWIAVAGRRPVRHQGNVVSVGVSAAYPNARVRSCASSEGLHFTVWAGTPLRSRRLWHEYFYLGYDVEPSCQTADYKE